MEQRAPDLNTPLYETFAPDPGVQPPCDPHDYNVIQHGDLCVWECLRCTRTVASAPGLQVCLEANLFPRARGESWHDWLMRLTKVPPCHRITTSTCPECECPFCSDHLPAHLIECLEVVP